MRRSSLGAIGLLLAAGALLGPRTVVAQGDLIGVWRAVERSGTGPDGEWKDETIQPSLYIFADGYYSIMFVGGNEARPLQAEDATRETLTDEQMRSIFMTFVANSGTYEVDGSSLTVRPIVALWPNYMEGGSTTYAYEVGENELVLTTGDFLWGEFRTKLVRLK
ncbi:MAG: hypothetical protein ACE5HP_04790 [Gemmatimonadota bacterium]